MDHDRFLKLSLPTFLTKEEVIEFMKKDRLNSVQPVRKEDIDLDLAAHMTIETEIYKMSNEDLAVVISRFLHSNPELLKGVAIELGGLLKKQILAEDKDMMDLNDLISGKTTKR